MNDYIARAITSDGAIRIFAARTTELVNEAARIHGCSATAAAALGRTLTGAAILGAMLKDEGGSVTLQLSGGGPLGRVVAISDSTAGVRGYCDNPTADLPLNSKGKLDVGGAIGTNGYLGIVRDYGLKEPYVGQIPLVTGEVGDDLTSYFANSEQVPSAVGLGVLVDRDLSVKAAGGFIVQLMPGATDAHIEALEKALSNIPSVSHLIDQGNTPEEIIEKLLPDATVFFYENIETNYFCNCSRERMAKALVSIGEKDLTDLIETDGHAELVCHFCNTAYEFEKDELSQLLLSAKTKKTAAE